MHATHFDPAWREKSAYKFWVREQVRFTDLDALGHVSAVRTNEYFNSARAALFEQGITNWPHAEQLPVMKLSVVVNDKEMHFPQQLDVGLVIEKWGTTSLTVVLGVFAGPECTALSRNIFVFIDAKTRAPVAPADYIKENFTRLASHG